MLTETWRAIGRQGAAYKKRSHDEQDFNLRRQRRLQGGRLLQRLPHGNAAENVARQFQITRDDKDAFAVASQNKAKAAQKAGKFKDEIVAFTIKGRKGDTLVDQDDYIRHGATLDAMTKLKPAFDQDGTITAVNASGINDGAAGALLTTEAEAARRGITRWCASLPGKPPASIRRSMGTGPIPASRKALRKGGLSVGDLDLVEGNEAFAAQACAVNKGMGWDSSIVNVNGGAIAIGHPIGASGARVFNTLIHEMRRRSANKGLATLGMGVAVSASAMNHW
ncbi:acetyl-CoA C-acyltransferase [Mesorhizobium sp. VK23B]|uniref:Acetyl-CoA C-acyltransferase n=1 Tax=Mesorhizobium dulcispinae TaxID=3072316 RepID=A0ABU4XQ01_9HYPH|nr:MULTISPECIES: acetyl-CoA C-acyltransferase [unclassified Mesorhizobium]MDX8469769.1 acetyl-CoA C-acyltransferase [Mesorhizobium sp. VK23B]MDX8476108.1 acetyl-CoA C-acyltransferase [Mesorhizobium sp. VK23A]